MVRQEEVLGGRADGTRGGVGVGGVGGGGWGGGHWNLKVLPIIPWPFMGSCLGEE